MSDDKTVSVKENAQKQVVMVTDWAGDQHFYGPFKNSKAAERWIKANVSYTLANEVEVDGMGRVIWNIMPLKGARRGL